MRIIKLLSIIFLFVFITFGIIGGCSSDNGSSNGSSSDGGDTGDGGEEPILSEISCEELVAILCERADKCGFAFEDACIFSYMFEDLILDCEDFIEEFNVEVREEFVSQIPSEECTGDMTSFSCAAFDNFDLPASCGNGWLFPPIPLPNNACGKFLNAQCSREDECNFATFDECLIRDLFLFEEIFGSDCDLSFEVASLDECVENYEDFNCDAFEFDGFPEGCRGGLGLVVNPPIEGACEICETSTDCAEGLSCAICSRNCTGDVMRCSIFTQPTRNQCVDGLF